MLSSQAVIETDRPSRYLAQLCRHAAAMDETGGGHRPRPHAAGAAPASGELRVSAECSETHGIVTIAPFGRCTLQVTDHTLALRVDATDDDALRQIQAIVTRDLERFGRREHLTVTWSPPHPSAPNPMEDDRTRITDRTTRGRPGRRTTVLLAVLTILAIALHLGVGGAILADSRWAGPSVDIILAIVVGKIILAALGGRALHHRHPRGHGPHLHARGRGPEVEVVTTQKVSGNGQPNDAGDAVP